MFELRAMLSLHYVVKLLFDLTLGLCQEEFSGKYGNYSSSINVLPLESRIQISNIIKKSLSRKDIPCIGYMSFLSLRVGEFLRINIYPMQGILFPFSHVTNNWALNK